MRDLEISLAQKQGDPHTYVEKKPTHCTLQ